MQIAAGNPLRLVAVLGVAAVLGGGMLVLKTTRGGETTAVAPKLVRTTAKPAGAPAEPVEAAPGKPVRPAARPKPKPLPPVTASGLPRSVAFALSRNPIVVVSVAAPKGRVDSLALAEARAGAVLAGAGFVYVNAYRQAEVAPLASKFAVRGNPAVIVLRRPDQISLKIDGFADRDSIAQAVTDARR